MWSVLAIVLGVLDLMIGVLLLVPNVATPIAVRVASGFFMLEGVGILAFAWIRQA